MELAEASHLTEHELKSKESDWIPGFTPAFFFFHPQVLLCAVSSTVFMICPYSFRQTVFVSNLWWELEQACQEVQSASVRHADDYVRDTTVGGLVEQLVEKSHHALCAFASVTFHRGELCS